MIGHRRTSIVTKQSKIFTFSSFRLAGGNWRLLFALLLFPSFFSNGMREAL